MSAKGHQQTCVRTRPPVYDNLFTLAAISAASAHVRSPRAAGWTLTGIDKGERSTHFRHVGPSLQPPGFPKTLCPSAAPVPLRDEERLDDCASTSLFTCADEICRELSPRAHQASARRADISDLVAAGSTECPQFPSVRRRDHVRRVFPWENRNRRARGSVARISLDHARSANHEQRHGSWRVFGSGACAGSKQARPGRRSCLPRAFAGSRTWRGLLDSDVARRAPYFPVNGGPGRDACRRACLCKRRSRRSRLHHRS